MRQNFSPGRVGIGCLKLCFWLTVAGLPLLIDHAITEFMLNGCMPYSDCLRYSMPLISAIQLIGWGARLLLWPLCVWMLVGQQLFSRLRARGKSVGG